MQLQAYVDHWLPRYYPRMDRKAFAKLKQDVHENRLPSMEWLYIVLGCGYLFEVRPIPPTRRLQEIQARVKATLGQEMAELQDERAIRKKIKEQGLVIGPEEHPLSAKRPPGPAPMPALKIAALCIDRWVCKQRPDLDPIPWACDLYKALTSRAVKVDTYVRWQKQANGVMQSLWLEEGPDRQPKETSMPLIDYLLRMFDSRYQRFQSRFLSSDAHPPSLDESPGALYPIGGVHRSVLKAVGIYIDPEPNPMAALFQKRG
jgi:hypothetical protein